VCREHSGAYRTDLREFWWNELNLLNSPRSQQSYGHVPATCSLQAQPATQFFITSHSIYIYKHTHTHTHTHIYIYAQPTSTIYTLVVLVISPYLSLSLTPSHILCRTIDSLFFLFFYPSWTINVSSLCRVYSFLLFLSALFYISISITSHLFRFVSLFMLSLPFSYINARFGCDFTKCGASRRQSLVF
jgi:hypothetical protein